MSKYTRLNKINHYHDSGSSPSSPSISLSNDDSRMVPPLCSTRFNKTKSITVNNIKQEPKLIATMHKSSKKLINLKLVQYKNLKLAFFAASIMSLLLLILVSINGVQSLNCYHCSSVDNPDCDEAFLGKANITDTDCEKHIGRPAKVCRKIVQYIEHKKVVIRSCGYIDEHEEKDKKSMCYKRSGTFAIMMESCNCYTDNCNHSASLVPNQSVSLLATIFGILFYLIQSSLFNPINSNNIKRLR